MSPSSVAGVGREANAFGEPRREALVGRQESVDLRVVPGDDHHQAIAIVLHPGQQGVDGFTAECVTA